MLRTCIFGCQFQECQKQFLWLPLHSGKAMTINDHLRSINEKSFSLTRRSLANWKTDIFFWISGRSFGRVIKPVDCMELKGSFSSEKPTFDVTLRDKNTSVTHAISLGQSFLSLTVQFDKTQVWKGIENRSSCQHNVQKTLNGVQHNHKDQSWVIFHPFSAVLSRKLKGN